MSRDLTVICRHDGWFVADADSRADVRGPFVSNAEAWRQCDNMTNEGHNAKESRHDWSANDNLRTD